MAVRIQEVRMSGVSLLFTSSNSVIIFHAVHGPAVLRVGSFLGYGATSDRREPFKVI